MEYNNISIFQFIFKSLKTNLLFEEKNSTKSKNIQKEYLLGWTWPIRRYWSAISNSVDVSINDIIIKQIIEWFFKRERYWGKRKNL